MTLDKIVSTYIRDYRPRARADMRFFEKRPSLAAAINNAVRPDLVAGSTTANSGFLRPCSMRSIAASRGCRRPTQAPDFAGVHKLVEGKISHLRDIGDLTAYDVAHRVGAFLGKARALSTSIARTFLLKPRPSAPFFVPLAPDSGRNRGLHVHLQRSAP